MFGLFISTMAFAEVPETAWNAVESQYHQQSVRDDVLIGSLLGKACKEGHKPSCQWSKKRGKWDDAALDTWLTEQCDAKQEPVACVVQGWKQSQLSIAPGIPHKSASDWDAALTTFAVVCEDEPRGCVELARLELADSRQSIQTQAVERLRNACDLGNAEGCYSYGVLLAEGVLQAPNVEKATEILRKTCSDGHSKSCAQMGLITLGQASNQQDAVRSTEFYQRGCELGSTEGCFGWAQHLEQGIGTNINLTQAAKLYERACSNYHAESCDKLGILYSEGRGVDSDMSKALELFEKGCAAENPFSCYNIAALYEQSNKLGKALSKLSRSCALGSGRGCFTYGLWLEQGKGSAIDLDTALNAYGKGCTLEYGQACVNGGILSYRAGRFEEALSLYQTGCNLGGEGERNGSCASYAMMLETGEAGVQNLDLARDLYQKSCIQGDKNACNRFYKLQGTVDDLVKQCRRGTLQSCYEAASRFEMGQSAVQNQSQAFEMVEYGCNQGHARSCVKQGYYLLRGVGTDVDVERARTLYEKACSEKDAKGCHGLGLMYAEGRGVEQNISVAVKMLGVACEMKEGVSCGAASYLLRSQASPDLTSSLMYAQKGCGYGNLDACAQEAFIYTQSPRTNLPQAAHLFKENCSRNHAKSCFNYAAMLHQGQGVPSDPTEAFRVMKHACVLGDAEACTILQR